MKENVPTARTGNWKPVVTLLVLSPAVGELLSGSSPPLQFFNPVFFLLLVGLYGCGALLVRETVARRRLNPAGILLLGAAYGIIEEGLTCKSFFNPHWTDTGYLSVYGRAWGVNWVWAFGLTVYHAVVSITVPIYLTEALFLARARAPWLQRRGWTITSASLLAVVILGFLGFDNRQFHLIELKDPLTLARQLQTPPNPVARFISGGLAPKTRDLVGRAVTTQADSPELRHALQEELNRLLPQSDLYSADRFAGITLPEDLQRRTVGSPRGDKLVELNRALLEHAFPGVLETRQVYPFRPGWWLTLGCMVAVAGLVLLALRQTRLPQRGVIPRRPWLTGLCFTLAFVIVGFVLPSLVEHGVRIPAVVACAIWCVVMALLGSVLRRMDAAPEPPWLRGLWAIGVLTPWVLFAILLGICVRMTGAKSFLGMPVVALVFGIGLLPLALKWRRSLQTASRVPNVTPVAEERHPEQSQTSGP